MTLTSATNRQVPDNSILDHFNKQVYLGNKFSCLFASTSAGTSETNVLLLRNPAISNSAFPSNYKGLFVDLRRLTEVTASDSVILRAYLNPVITGNGTSQTATNLRIASPNTPTGLVSSAPTTSNLGTLIEVIAIPALSTLSSESLIILDPGMSLLLTLQASASSQVSALQVSWAEI